MCREELLSSDEKLFAYKWLFVGFVVATPIIIAFEDRKNFLHTLIEFSWMGLSWPLLVLTGLYFFRRRFLLRLMERGREVEATVTSVKPMKKLYAPPRRRIRELELQRVEVAFRLDGEAKTTDIEVRPGTLQPDAHVTLLVDPLNVRRALFLKVH